MTKLNTNDPVAVIATGNLDWKPIKMPLGIIGNTETRPIPNRRAIVHNRTGRFLDICSDQYHIHEPAKIVSAACNAFSDVGLNVTGVQTLHGGKSVLLEASLNPGEVNRMRQIGAGQSYMDAKTAREREGYRLDQPLEARVTMKIGNTVGNPTTVTGSVVILACLNSATRSQQLGLRIINHRNAQEEVIISLQEILPELRKVQQEIITGAGRLVATPASLETMRAYLLELSEPQLFDQVLQKTVSRYGESAPDVRRNLFLDAVNSHDEVAWYLLNAVDKEGNRFTKRLYDNLESQPMANETRGTLFQPYNAVSYVVDHKATGRGEFAADNILDNSLFGQGQKVKAESLDLCLQYATANNRLN